MEHGCTRESSVAQKSRQFVVNSKTKQQGNCRVQQGNLGGGRVCGCRRRNQDRIVGFGHVVIDAAEMLVLADPFAAVVVL
jgi:hypothetical protein